MAERGWCWEAANRMLIVEPREGGVAIMLRPARPDLAVELDGEGIGEGPPLCGVELARFVGRHRRGDVTDALEDLARTLAACLAEAQDAALEGGA